MIYSFYDFYDVNKQLFVLILRISKSSKVFNRFIVCVTTLSLSRTRTDLKSWMDVYHRSVNKAAHSGL